MGGGVAMTAGVPVVLLRVIVRLVVPPCRTVAGENDLLPVIVEGVATVNVAVAAA